MAEPPSSASRDRAGPSARDGGPRDDLRRRLVHLSGAAVPLAYLADVVAWEQVRLLYVVGLAIAVALEVARLVVGLEWWLVRELTREYERSTVAGYALYVVGSTVAVLGFAPRVAVPALLILAVVDPVSGMLARNEFPEPKRPAVLATTFALSGLIALPFVTLPAAVAAGTVTALADGYTPVVAGHVLDDNLTIPVGAAVAMWLALKLLV